MWCLVAGDVPELTLIKSDRERSGSVAGEMGNVEGCTQCNVAHDAIVPKHSTKNKTKW